MWFRAMLLATLLNGLSPFGLRILAGMGLAKQYTQVYLFFWYLAGFVFLAVWALVRREKVSLATLAVGSAMALCSVGGQVSIGLALANGVPGNAVYPITIGASICLVAAGGVLIFKEKVGLYGKLGILTGILAAVLLSLGG